jgi:4-alpha-glucanotransferase
MISRRSGISVPLFSLASRQGWGIGEFADLPVFARWLDEAGQSVVQILPIHEMPPLETSPYSAMTAMALDPIYIRMAEVPDFSGLGAELALDGAEQAEVRRLRQSPRIEYASIRRLKDRWLRRSSFASWSRAARRARRASMRSPTRSRGGSTNSHCFGRCTRATTSGRGRTGRSRWRGSNRRRSATPAPWR